MVARKQGWAERLSAGQLPTRQQVVQFSDVALEALTEALDDYDSEERTDAIFELSRWVENEMEQREYASSDDERVRDAFGYGSRVPS